MLVLNVKHNSIVKVGAWQVATADSERHVTAQAVFEVRKIK